MTAITFAQTCNTSGVSNFNGMFYGCSKLTSIDLSPFDTSKASKVSGICYNCSAVTSVTYFRKTSSAATRVYDFWSGLSSRVKTIDFSAWDASNVQNMSGLCSSMNSATTITFSSTFNTSNVTNMKSMFSSCIAITSLDVSMFNTSKVTNMNSMFSDCLNLSTLNTSNFVTSAVTDMSYMFSSCAMPHINVTNFNTSKVTNMGYMFGGNWNNMTRLTGVTLPTNFGVACTNMTGLFARCTNLVSVNLTNLNTSKATDMSYMFTNCSKLTGITVADNFASAAKFVTSFFGNCSALTTADFSKWSLKNLDFSWEEDNYGNSTQNNVTCAGEMIWDEEWQSYYCDDTVICINVLTNCPNVKTVKYFKHTPSSGISVSLGLGLPKLSSVTTVDCSAWDMSNVNDMNYLCSGLTKLSSITFGTTPKTSSGLTSMKRAFISCSTLTSLDLSAIDASRYYAPQEYDEADEEYYYDTWSTPLYGVNSVKTLKFFRKTVANPGPICHLLGSSAFTSIDCSAWDMSNLTNLQNICSGMSQMTAITFAQTCNTSGVTSFSAMFYGCSGLTSLNLSSFDTSKATITTQMFYNCTKLTSIIFGPKADVSKVVSSYSNMFYNITTTGTLYYPIAYSDSWNYLLVTKRSSTRFPSTWTAKVTYTPQTCTSLTITAEDVESQATSTTISYTAITNGYDSVTQSTITGVQITGTAISHSFKQNTSTSSTVTRTITFEYLGATASTTITQSAYKAQTYTINLNSQWRLNSSVNNPNSSLYDGVYASYSNQGVSNSIAKMTITIEGYSNFKLYIRSDAESNYDYVMVSQLDKDLTTGSTGSTYMKASTSGNQNSSTAITAYTLVEFTGIDGGKHVITVAYRKDGSVDEGYDSGYLLIPKDQ